MDELIVAGDTRESVDPFLRHRMPLRNADFGADFRAKLFD
jgi:hypothetical protein